jgi:hypothetical protein
MRTSRVCQRKCMLHAKALTVLPVSLGASKGLRLVTTNT